MEKNNIATFPKPVFGRIANFGGAERAAQNLRDLPEYKSARVVFCNPDSPQRPVREMVLRDDKALVMATPRLRQGFLLIDPAELSRLLESYERKDSSLPDHAKVTFLASSMQLFAVGG